MHQAIWAALLASSALIPGLVQAGNTVSVLDPKPVEKRSVVSRKLLPSIDIAQGSFVDSPLNSLADKRTQTFKAFVSSPVLGTVVPLNQIKDAVISAVKAPGDDLGLPGLVYTTRFQNSSESFTKRETDRPGGRAGFTAVVNILVEMRIAK